MIGADGGLFRIANASGLPSASVSLAASTTGLSFLNYTHTMPLGSLSGVVGSFLSGSVPDNNIPPAGTVVTWQIGGRNLDSTFSGVIQNGNGSSQTAVRKTGTATLTLTAANTYTGPTTVAIRRMAARHSRPPAHSPMVTSPLPGRPQRGSFSKSAAAHRSMGLGNCWTPGRPS